MINLNYLKDINLWIARKDTLYVGRFHPRFGASKFANPFKLKNCSSRNECLEMYEQHIRATPQLFNAINELEGLELGCWCKPLACHADVLLKLFKES